MSAKRKRLETRTILIILLVIVIIAAVYIIITNLPVEEEFFTPEEILNNKESYLNGEQIIVKGLYDLDGGAEVVVSTLSTEQGRVTLELNLSGLTQNETDVLITGNKYKFTGVLTLNEDDPLGLSVIFKVAKIEEV
jgi:hypothetical protein